MARFILATADSLTVPGGEQFFRLAGHLHGRGHEVVLLHADEGDSSSSRSTIPSEFAGKLSIIAWPSASPKRLIDAILLVRILIRFRPDCVVGRRAALNLTMVLGRLAGVRARVAWDDTCPPRGPSTTGLGSDSDFS